MAVAYRPIADFKTLRCPLYQGNACLMGECPAWQLRVKLPSDLRYAGPGDEKPFAPLHDAWGVELEKLGPVEVAEREYVPVTNWRGKVVGRKYQATGRKVPGHEWKPVNTLARCRVLMPNDQEI